MLVLLILNLNTKSENLDDNEPDLYYEDQVFLNIFSSKEFVASLTKCIVVDNKSFRKRLIDVLLVLNNN